MSNFLKLISMVILMAFMFTSCEKENIDLPGEIEVQVPDPEVTEINPLLNKVVGSRSNQGLDLECFTILYPFDMLLEDGTTITIGTNDDLEALSEEENPPVDFVYPLNIETETEGTEVVNTAEELGNLFISCVPDDGWGEGDWGDGSFGEVPVFDINFENFCFELVYPISVHNIDDEVTVANNAEELATIVAEEAGLSFFVFPLTVTFENGETEELGSSDELFEAMFSCNGFTTPSDSTIYVGGQIACYDLGYPLMLETISGVNVTVNTEDELFNLLFEGQVTNFVFPLTLIAENGEVLEVGSQEEMEAAFIDCYEGGFDTSDALLLYFGGLEGCYSISYPISVNDDNGTTITISDDADFLDQIYSGNGEELALVYPVAVTVTASQEGVTLNDEGDIISLLSICE